MNVKRCSQSWTYRKIYKLFRYIFVSTYYYLVPFFILVFQTMLLYANEIYTQYLNDKEATADSGIEADLLVTTPTDSML